MLLAGLAIAVPTAIYTLANISRAGNPAFALRLVGNDARALEKLSDVQFEASLRSRKWEGAEALAQAALKRDATSVRAARTLGMVADLERRPKQAALLIQYANKLSRRDLGVHLYLIEQHVAKEDARGALRQFDLALRTSNAAFDILTPVLSGAIGDPQLRAPIAELFDTDPEWLPRFLEAVIPTTESPKALAQVLLAARKSHAARAPEATRQLLQRFIKDEEFRFAKAFYTARTPAAKRGTGLVVDGNFTSGGEAFPFGWSYTLASDIGAESTPPQGLRYYASMGQGGRAATQLLTLDPGTYRLVSVATNPSTDGFAGPAWVMRCAGARGRELMTMRFPRQAQRDMQMSRVVTIPSQSCAAQWLLLELRGTQEQEGLDGFVRSVRIVPAGK